VDGSQLNVGRQYNLAPNIGLEEFWGLHDSGVSKTHTRRSGVSETLNALVLAKS